MGTYTWGYNSEATILITLIRGLLTPPIIAHEPPSRLFLGLESEEMKVEA